MARFSYNTSHFTCRNLTGDRNVYGMNPLENQTGSYHFSPEGLKLISRCPLCSESYQPFQASIVEEKQEAQLLHIQCRKCQSCIVALIVSGQLGDFSRFDYRFNVG